MTEKPTYEELAKRVEALEQEKLGHVMIADAIMNGAEWLTQKNNKHLNCASPILPSYPSSVLILKHLWQFDCN